MSDERTTATTIEPVRCSVVLRCSPARAFQAYTAEMGRWWPTTTHAIAPGRVVDVVVDGRVGGTIRERLDDGTEHAWADITAWEPPDRLGLSWHPSIQPTVSTDIDIRFVDQGDGTTRMDVVHTGWERLGADAQPVRDDYDRGWRFVLGHYTRHLDGASTST
jgi:hypothetical protein